MIFETSIGSTKIGGETGLPFLVQEAKFPNKPKIAFEIWDMPMPDLPENLKKPFQDVLNNPLEMALKCIDDFKAELLCIRLASIHPDTLDKKPGDAIKFIEKLMEKTNVGIIILGCGNNQKDNLVLPECCKITKGKNFTFGSATQDNYKILTKACLENNHSIIAESPIDINIAKQLNILINDAGMPLDRIIINPTVGALGYGLEYAYSIMERGRLAALSGDSSLAQSFICLIGQEAWKAKEAKAKKIDNPSWGDEEKRGVLWETITAVSFLLSGADVLVMRHPEAVNATRAYINDLLE